MGGYLKGLLDLAGMRLVTDNSGIVKIVDDKTNPNNPKFQESVTIDKPKIKIKLPEKTEKPKQQSNTLYYILGGLVVYKLLK